MDEYQREDLIKRVELKEGRRAQVLEDLGIPRSTYYKWRKTFDEDGIPGLAGTKPIAKRVWNRLADIEIKKSLKWRGCIRSYHQGYYRLRLPTRKTFRFRNLPCIESSKIITS